MADTAKDLRKRENTRARIIEAAADVFVDKGLEGAKIDDVVKAAGFSRGAFYSNYSSMQELMRDVIVARSKRILDTVDEAVDALGNDATIDSVMTVLDAIHGQGRAMYILTTEFNLYRMRHPEAFEEGPDTIAERRHFEDRLSGIIIAVLAKMGRRALFPPGTIAHVISVFYLDALVSSEGDPNAELLRQVVESVIIAFSQSIDAASGGAEAPCGDVTVEGVDHLISFIKRTAAQG